MSEIQTDGGTPIDEEALIEAFSESTRKVAEALRTIEQLFLEIFEPFRLVIQSLNNEGVSKTDES